MSALELIYYERRSDGNSVDSGLTFQLCDIYSHKFTFSQFMCGF